MRLKNIKLFTLHTNSFKAIGFRQQICKCCSKAQLLVSSSINSGNYRYSNKNCLDTQFIWQYSLATSGMSRQASHQRALCLEPSRFFLTRIRTDVFMLHR